MTTPTPIEMINGLTAKHYQKIERLISPLKCLGIDYFAWQKVSHDGCWSILGNRPDWLEYSAAHQFYLVDPTLKDPNFYQSGMALASCHEHPEFQNSLSKHAIEKFNLHHGLAVINKTSQGSEWTFFATHNSHPKIINSYINHKQELIKFINYFKKEMASAIGSMQENRVNIADLKQELYGASSNLFEITQQKLAFQTSVQLTKREQDCLSHLLQGKTAKETAQILGLSHRTVEEYLNNIKRKCGLRYKRDLFSL